MDFADGIVLAYSELSGHAKISETDERWSRG